MSDCFVYLMVADFEDESGWTVAKVGISNNPWVRLDTIQTASPIRIASMHLWRLPDRRTALEVESAFHDQHEKLRTHGEWFRIIPVGAMIDLDQICCEVWANRGHSYEDVRAFASFFGMNPDGFDSTMANARVPATCQ